MNALVGDGCGRVNIVRNKTCLIDAAFAADFSLSSCLGEREALTMSDFVVLPWGGVTDRDGGLRVTRVKRSGDIDIERQRPCSFRFVGLVLEFLPRGE
jgi:hypothetical protein